MYEDMAAKMAHVAVEYSTEIKPGDFVAIRAGTNAEPLVMAMLEALWRAGANVKLDLALPGAGELFFGLASDAQLEFFPPGEEEWMKVVDVYMVLDSPANTKSMSGIDPTRIQKRQQASAHLNSIFFGRFAEDPPARYFLTLWPTNAAAQQAEMGLLAFREFVYKACGLDQDDPVAYWRAFRERQERLAAWLADKSRCQVRGPGINLSFDFKDRLWISCHGDANFPDGEIFTAPVEDSVNGRVEFSYPSLYQGTEVNGVKLTFKDGVVVEASAEKGEDTLLAQLDVDEGARRLGEFAIGTNMGIQRYTGNTLFDEKIGGTIHMALGNTLPESKGVNRSSIHWDIVHGMQDGGEILIDGELFYRAGQFMIE